jgi:glycosyltransferase involved in cell wall biosynthesis
MRIIHVAEVELDLATGMGRVALHWIEALRKRGHDVVHVGPRAVGRVRHPALFPKAAKAAVRRLGSDGSVVLVHEPASGAFVGGKGKVVVFSHGLERRGWEVAKRLASNGDGPRISWRSRMLFPLWRLRPSDSGIRRADGLLVINREDGDFTRSYYRRSDFFLFRNGADPVFGHARDSHPEPTVLFLGNWLARKGIAVLARASVLLDERGVRPRWLLAGTGAEADDVLRSWPVRLHARTEVLPRFRPDEEATLLARADVMVLPSYFEGQPLALIQAMAAGCCCVASNCCGQKDLIRDGENGLLHSPGDSEALAQRLSQVLLDSRTRMRLGAAARESMSGRLWPEVADDVARYVEEVAR